MLSFWIAYIPSVFQPPGWCMKTISHSEGNE